MFLGGFIMSINRNDNFDDIFDDNFEVIYEGELPDIPAPKDDNYKDVLASLSELDNTRKIDYLEENYTASFDTDVNDHVTDNSASGRQSNKNSKNKKHRKMPNLLSPAAKTAKAGGKLLYNTVNLLLRAGTLILIACTAGVLAVNFWKNYGTYGNISNAIAQENYILGAYFGVALFLLLVECISFLMVLFGSKTNGGRDGRRMDTGRGLFSFIFIYTGSYLSSMFARLIPASPAPLQGVQGALTVYGSLNSTLLILCAAGIISCLIRRFLVR